MAVIDLTDFEWSVIASLLPYKPRGIARVDDRRVLNRIFWRLRRMGAVGGHPGALRAAYDLREPLQSMAQSWCVGSVSGGGFKGL